VELVYADHQRESWPLLLRLTRHGAPVGLHRRDLWGQKWQTAHDDNTQMATQILSDCRNYAPERFA